MKLDKLHKLVEKQYCQKHPNRDDWADWMYTNHVLWVGDKTKELCGRYDADSEIAVAAALVHDIADSIMPRNDEQHAEKGKDIGRKLCTEAGYTDEQIAVIIDDIVVHHSCYGDDRPSSLESKVMVAADALAHVQTDFFPHAFAQGSAFGDYDWQITWMRKKLDKDFNNKLATIPSKQVAKVFQNNV